MLFLMLSRKNIVWFLEEKKFSTNIFSLMCFNIPQQLLCKWESKEGKLLHSAALNIALTKPDPANSVKEVCESTWVCALLFIIFL